MTSRFTARGTNPRGLTPRAKTLAFAGTLALAGSLMLASCSTDTASTDTTAAETTTSDTTVTSATTASYISLTELTELSYEDLGIADFDVETSGATTITLADGATEAVDGVSVDGDTITITAGGIYRLTGELTAGQVIIDAGEEDVTLVLDGVSITASAVGAIQVANADDVQIYLASGSDNTLADASGATVSTDEDAVNATLYSTADLWIGGTGSLTITEAANDGITSKDSLVIDGATLDVTATDDAIRGKDHLVILDGDITVNAGGDGLTSDDETGGTDATATVGVVWIEGGTLDVTSGDDGVVGYRQVTITGGDITVNASDDGVHTEGVMHISGGDVAVESSVEGLEAAIMTLSGGDITVNSSDDGINVAGGPGVESSSEGGMGGGMGGGQPGGGESASSTGRSLVISGGNLVVTADGDGIDVNGSFAQSGGVVVVNGPEGNGNGAFDVDSTATVSGGILIAGGSAGMAMAPSSDGQGVIGVSFGSSVAAGTRVTVTDSAGTVIASYVTTKVSETVVVSAPGMSADAEYTISTGGTVSGGSTTAGVTTGGSLSGQESLGSVTAG